MKRTVEFYILDGTEVVAVTLEEWARWLNDHRQEKFIKRTDLGDFWVSTVFLGLDHNYLDDGPPLLFETMVFKRGDWGGEYQTRSSTHADALRQHETACQWVRDGCPSDENIHDAIDNAIRSMRRFR